MRSNLLFIGILVLAQQGGVHAQDTIESRAQAALAKETAKNSPPQQVMAVDMKPAPMKARPVETTLVGIRGYSDDLQATLLINGVRFSGSTKFPTLGDGWMVVAVERDGATISKGKEVRKLGYVAVAPVSPVGPAGPAIAQGALPNSPIPPGLLTPAMAVPPVPLPSR